MVDVEVYKRILLEHAAALIAIFDGDDRLRYANAAFRESYGIGPEEAPRWVDIVTRNHVAGRGTRISTTAFDCWLASTLSQRRKAPVCSFESAMADGRTLWITETTLPDGWAIHAGVDITTVCQDAVKLREDRDNAMKAALTDPLTHVSNRRHVMELLERALDSPCPEGGEGGSVVLFDLDHFKRINDRFGHEGGDRVLVSFAREVRGLVRAWDGFGRVGGEEFLLILRGLEPPASTEMVERIMAAIRRSRPLSDYGDFAYTCSAGLVRFVRGDCPQSILRLVDAALYEAKDNGRNRLAWATPASEGRSPRPDAPAGQPICCR